ncbi:transporter substrate-binding domain-containing protein [Streptomyces cyaneofuscatus]|uniref:transporter substrate-binding domain-containing protein n=1 Tax=Streptomyces TaxID=1883 RepID=UPI002E1530A8|nr:transporter substrate-binding domain-containing protein [Streptomyces cyaneofuscatus]WTF34562.1 transporter substrate-binding domain-containing protein [Streptomyces cyaneofuscatus]
MAPTSETQRPARTARLLGSVVALAVLASFAGCSSAQEPEREFLGVRRVTVAMHNDLPGLSYSANYDRSGLDFLVFRHIEEEIDVDFSEPVDVSSGDRVTQLIERKADMTIASFSITAERMDEIDFVGPYLKTRQGFLVGPDSADVKRLADLRGSQICTWQGTTSVEALQGIKETVGAEPVTLTDASDCIEQLIAGQVKAVSTDQAILYGFARQYEKEGLRVVPDVTIGAPQHYGIGLPKGHTADCRKLASWLKKHVGTSSWIRDVETSLPTLIKDDPAWISSYKPSAAEIEARSCRDSISP